MVMCGLFHLRRKIIKRRNDICIQRKNGFFCLHVFPSDRSGDTSYRPMHFTLSKPPEQFRKKSSATDKTPTE